MIDLSRIDAIDVHVHTERSRDGHDPMPPVLREAAGRYFRSDVAPPNVDDVVAYYRERNLAAVLFTVGVAAQDVVRVLQQVGALPGPPG